MTNRRGVISIGTNSTRALVAEGARVLLHRWAGTRIGEGLKEGGKLDPEAAQRTLKAIEEHARAVRELTDDVCIIATSALRRAEDCESFARRVRGVTGVPLQVISGEEEARCSYIGAISGLQSAPGQLFGVIDVGGGSTEYATGGKQGAQRIVSCEIGAVRLTEEVPELSGRGGATPVEAVRKGLERANEAIEPIRSLDRVDRLIFVGGSATTTIDILRANQDSSYVRLSRAQLDHCVRRLASLSLEQRRTLPGMNPQRADILLAGQLILDAVLELTGHQGAVVSSNDLLLGFLLRD